LDKGYHAGVSEFLYNEIKKNNGIIVNLDEEGAVDFSDNSTLKERYSKKLFDYADMVFMWGINQYNLVSKNADDIKRVIVTGHPRFELLQPKFHHLYNQEVTQITKKYGKFILINTNMGFGNNIKGDEFIIKNYIGRFSNIKKIVKYDKIKLNSYVELILELANKIDRKIIVRPHPEEDHSPYEHAFRSIENINVIYSGSVVPWLLAAEEVIHPDCTTAVETSFLGKLPISFMPENYAKDIVTKIPLEISVQFNKPSQVIDYLINKRIYIKDEIKRQEVLNDYFSHNKSTSKIIVDTLKKIGAERKIEIDEKNIKKLIFFLKIKQIYNSLIKNKETFFLRTKLKGFDKRNIIKIQNLLLECDISNNVTFRKYNKNLFLFHKIH
jgi:surface carbohydrate biosynthesis protein